MIGRRVCQSVSRRYSKGDKESWMESKLESRPEGIQEGKSEGRLDGNSKVRRDGKPVNSLKGRTELEQYIGRRVRRISWRVG